MNVFEFAQLVVAVVLVFFFFLYWVSDYLFFFHLSHKSPTPHAGRHWRGRWNEHPWYRCLPANVCLALKTNELPGDQETEKEEKGPVERGWDSWAMWNVSVCFWATIVLWCWNVGKARGYWIRSHVDSSCQHVISSLYKEKFSPDPNFIVSDSYTFPRALYATGLHLGSLWLWSLFRLALETWYLAWEGVLIDMNWGVHQD